ncbi:L-threonylcarbamoyladenylate synthase [Acidihalobacter prosperus]|uniref:Threonylcarbamoyl-AMP synthase n=1 Tax=Acidihalobacter prosperus TaxID=160660 RepID=A0A1A6C7B2_9GAMM|nr:L-threonylcarbamoyladenylate synthase [Acidihalobacter prosperus]OBS10451.1 threonylcarbamoyl-AMP synthase [Acidihalobacter prosperus]
MSQYFEIHPDNPQPRLLRQAVDILSGGGVIVYPTDSCYALGCVIGDKSAQERIRRIRRLDDSHHFTLVCRDLSEISTYAKVDDRAYRLMKALTPGAYTFLLPATREVPRRLQNPKRKAIGLRVPDNTVTQALLDALGGPLMSTTLWLPGDTLPHTVGYEIRERLEHEVDLVIDSGTCGVEPTTVIDLYENPPRVLREGKGEIGHLLED